MELWHNPRCSKSRQAKGILDDRGSDYIERRYLDDPPTAAELDAVLTALGMEPWDIARKGEAAFAEAGLADAPKDRDTWIAAMVAHPILIERPIVVKDGKRAVLGRPPENVDALL